MAFTVKDIWWKYQYPDEKKQIEIVVGTPLNQSKFVLKGGVSTNKKKADVKTTLNNIIIFESQTFEMLWNGREISQSAVLTKASNQQQIKEILFKRNQYLEKQNTQLMQQIKVLFIFLHFVFCLYIFMFGFW